VLNRVSGSATVTIADRVVILRNRLAALLAVLEDAAPAAAAGEIRVRGTGRTVNPTASNLAASPTIAGIGAKVKANRSDVRRARALDTIFATVERSHAAAQHEGIVLRTHFLIVLAAMACRRAGVRACIFDQVEHVERDL
jgi:hypothetical protein